MEEQEGEHGSHDGPGQSIGRRSVPEEEFEMKAYTAGKMPSFDYLFKRKDVQGDYETLNDEQVLAEKLKMPISLDDRIDLERREPRNRSIPRIMKRKRKRRNSLTARFQRPRSSKRITLPAT